MAVAGHELGDLPHGGLGEVYSLFTWNAKHILILFVLLLT